MFNLKSRFLKSTVVFYLYITHARGGLGPRVDGVRLSRMLECLRLKKNIVLTWCQGLFGVLDSKTFEPALASLVSARIMDHEDRS